ncbi:MAG: DHA2 family efflux MFS transporter permease subunit [Sphingobacteriia bacterium]|nr:DHA2 family efflux MFS transporter permease subunit [Sphingobacteriia bacterium]
MQARELSPYPVGTERAILVLTAISAALLQLIDTSIVNVSLREISGSIGATTTEIAWAVTSYAISNVIMIPLAGMFSDLFGRRNYFTISILIFTVASFFCGTADSLTSLIIWRFIQGIGGGALLTTSQTIIVEAYPPEQINTANAIFGMGVILGPTFGPTLGGYLTDNYSWHWIFFINIPIGIMAAYLSWTYVKDRLGARKPEKIDWAGIGLLILAIGCLQYVLEEGTAKDWFESKEILLFTLLSIVGFVGFIWREWTFEHPAVNIRLLKSWNLAMGSILNFIVGLILLATVFVFPLFAQVGLGWTATMTGNFLISGALASAFSMAVVGKMLNRGISPKLIMIAGGVMIFAFTTMMSFSAPDSSETNFFWPFILRGLGIGFMMSPVMVLAMQGLKGADLSQGAGISNMIRQLGGAVGIAVMNVFLTHRNAENDNYLLQHYNVYNDQFQNTVDGLTQNFAALGYFKEDARQLAYKVMDLSLFKQQAIVSYNNVFWTVGLSILVCIPIILLIRNNKKHSGEKIDVHLE